MPEPTPDPHWPQVRRVATVALVAGLLLVAAKFAAFWLTNSAAVLSDALESIINVVAAAVMLYTLRLSNEPPDRNHPYGHGKAEFMAVAFEGALILMAGLLLAFEGVRRLFSPPEFGDLDRGSLVVAAIGVVGATLAVYVLRAGKRYGSAVLVADGKHLLTDVFTTAGALAGLLLVRWTELAWIDAALTIVFAAIIVVTSWRLLGASVGGLMDEADPQDDAAVRDILTDAVRAGEILGFHKVRVRRTGAFRWVDMHIQVDRAMNVADAHELASRLEHRIEQRLGSANATAHVEPALAQPPRHDPQDMKSRS